MPIRTEIEDNKRRRPINKLPIPPLPMASPEGKPTFLPKNVNRSPQLRLVNNASPQLSSATALLSLNPSSTTPTTPLNDQTTTNDSSSSPSTKSAASHILNRKAVHLASEKKRRQNISDGFSDLRAAINNACLPSKTSAIIMPSDSKAAVLRKAAVALAEQTEEIKRMRTQFYGKSGPPPSPRMVTLVSNGKGGGGGANTLQIDDKDVMESAATLTTLQHMTEN